MPLDLHPGCASALRERLPEALVQVHVDHKRYVDYDTLADLEALDAALPDHGGGAEELHRILGAKPFSNFVTERLNELLGMAHEFEADHRSALGDLSLAESLGALADRLVDDFLSLPWEYSIHYQLPGELAAPLLLANRRVFVMSPTESILEWTEADQATFPGPQEDESAFAQIFAPLKPRAQVGGSYVRLRVEGFLPTFGVRRIMAEAERTLRAICGLGIALHVWERGWGGSLFGPPQASALVWRRAGDKWGPQAAQTIPAELAEALAALRIARSVKEMGEENTTAWARLQFLRILRLWQKDEASSIVRASRWLFDSYVGSNELLSFIQATVSVEILLGDKAVSDIVGLTELLANRCAYLIGDSKARRDELLDDFREIYQTRSRIVHRGVETLSPEDEDRLWRLRWICMRVIQREMELLFPRKTQKPAAAGAEEKEPEAE